MMNQDKIYINEVAKILGVSRRTIYRYIEKGAIPESDIKRTLGDRIYFTAADVLKYADGISKEEVK